MKPNIYDSIAYTTIKGYMDKYLPSDIGLKILDVGAKEINGTYKTFCTSPKWQYIGIDIEEGKNVDLVVPPYQWPFDEKTFDVVISGQCLEHVEYPWLWIDEIGRVMKSGAFVFISVPSIFKKHRFPVDCWRVLEDGMVALFRWGKINVVEIKTAEQRFAGKYVQFTFGVGVRW